MRMHVPLLPDSTVTAIALSFRISWGFLEYHILERLSSFSFIVVVSAMAGVSLG